MNFCRSCRHFPRWWIRHALARVLPNKQAADVTKHISRNAGVRLGWGRFLFFVFFSFNRVMSRGLISLPPSGPSWSSGSRRHVRLIPLTSAEPLHCSSTFLLNLHVGPYAQLMWCGQRYCIRQNWFSQKCTSHLCFHVPSAGEKVVEPESLTGLWCTTFILLNSWQDEVWNQPRRRSDRPYHQTPTYISIPLLAASALKRIVNIMITSHHVFLLFSSVRPIKYVALSPGRSRQTRIRCRPVSACAPFTAGPHTAPCWDETGSPARANTTPLYSCKTNGGGSQACSVSAVRWSLARPANRTVCFQEVLLAFRTLLLLFFSFFWAE